MTTAAVALGVMLMAGSYIFTDTFSKGFDQLFANAFKGTDVSISAKTAFDLDDFTQAPPTVPVAALARVKQVDGVKAAEGSIFDSTATILDKKGDPIGVGGAPQSIASTSSVPQLDAFDFTGGRAPRNPDEVALDESTADREDFKLGDTVRVAGSGRTEPFKLVGLLTLGGSGSIGGSSIALFTLPEAQLLTGKQRRFDAISVVAAPGVTPEQLRDRIAKALGPKFDVKTGQQEQEDQASDIREGLSFLRIFLNVFAGIALFVGAFLIFNTFSITVAQRLREIALLRTLGASRGQVLRSVLTEGLVIGFAGSLIGLGLGALIATGLQSLLGSFGIELPKSGLVLSARTVILSLGIGMAITLVSALLPALRATRIPPIAALQEGARLPRGRGAKFLVPIAIALFVAGLIVVVLGLPKDDDTGLLIRGGGALIAFIGFGLLTPKFVVPLASFIGRPGQAVRGITGRLARENTMREPGRTAITASALMIGVALVTFALIFTSSIKATLAEAVDQNLLGNAVALDRGGQFQPFAAKALDELATDKDVEYVGGISDAQALVSKTKEPSFISGVDPRTFAKLYDMDIIDGPDDAISRLSPATAIVDDDYAKKNGLKLGDSLAMVTATGALLAPRIIATKSESGAYALTQNVIVPNSVTSSAFDVNKYVFGLMQLRDGVDTKKVTKRLNDQIEKTYPRMKVQTSGQFQDEQKEQINVFLGIIFGLLGLSIIVAIFGIVNTLVLAITERTRELGLLRAIGTSRRQVRSMVRYESVITALIGTVLGCVVGILFGLAVALPSTDISFAIPYVSIVVVLILGAIVGVFAAIWPAWRASKLNVLEALSYE